MCRGDTSSWESRQNWRMLGSSRLEAGTKCVVAYAVLDDDEFAVLDGLDSLLLKSCILDIGRILSIRSFCVNDEAVLIQLVSGIVEFVVTLSDHGVTYVNGIRVGN